MLTPRLIHKLSANPKGLFLIDGCGALLSAFLLGVVLVRFESIFGIPIPTLYFLAFLPAVFGAYDLYCFIKVTVKIDLYLKILAYLNIIYCFLSFGIAIYHPITFFGWVYILFEIFVVIALAKLELRLANQVRLRRL